MEYLLLSHELHMALTRSRQSEQATIILERATSTSSSTQLIIPMLDKLLSTFYIGWTEQKWQELAGPTHSDRS
ncbi:hypothetical protein KPH14_005281 [Odynerus spinipes]|uniref:Uncharacterized protein n=1 Tax=Odynerus spinipes TaxID=1348599 RepID=A0AAD9RBB7_9HYME|nr:hypothetical protein KPH14_005281 [Odynerus spinipes]